MAIALKKGLEAKLLKLKSQKKGIRTHLENLGYSDVYINQVVKYIGTIFTKSAPVEAVQDAPTVPHDLQTPVVTGPLIEINIDEAPAIPVALGLGFEDDATQEIKNLIFDTINGVLLNAGAQVDLYEASTDNLITHQTTTNVGALAGISIDLIK